MRGDGAFVEILVHNRIARADDAPRTVGRVRQGPEREALEDSLHAGRAGHRLQPVVLAHRHRDDADRGAGGEVLLDRLGNLLERGAREIAYIDGADGLEGADGVGFGCVEVNEDKGERILRRILQTGANCTRRSPIWASANRYVASLVIVAPF